MPDDKESKPFVVHDKRRVDERGRRKQPLKIPGRREVQFKDIKDPLDSAFRYFRAQLEHLPGGSWPRSGHIRDLLRGFIVSTQELYAATLILIADNRPIPLVMPAGIVARSIVEALGNVLALLDAPETAPALFLRDDYLNTYKKARYHGDRFGKGAAFEKEMRKLRAYGEAMNLTEAEFSDPEKALSEWPTPGKMMKKGFLSGDRRSVFEEVYGFWYRSLSAFSHQRVMALQLAIFTEEQPHEETFAMAKSSTASLVVTCALCVLSEVEAFLSIAPNRPLRAAWQTVRDIDKLVAAVYEIRYAALLKIKP